MSSDEDQPGCSSTYHSPPRKKAKVWYKQAFKQEWLEEEEFKSWVKADPSDKFSAVCCVCDATIKNCSKSRLLSHKNSTKHAKNFAAKRNMTVIDKFVVKKTEPDKKEKVHRAELLLTGFMAEHGMPFSQANHLIPVIKKMFPDCDTAQNMTLMKTKAAYVMQDGIAWEESHDISKVCQENMFSLIIDESTDISVSQILAVMVRYYDGKKCKVTDALLDIIEVDDASAESLYKAVKTLLSVKMIPVSNIIGFASDNCSTMLGSKSGFQAYLKRDVPSVFVLGCICHSFALCASHACSTLPSFLEQFLRDICCYFSRSSKRTHQFQVFQDITKSPQHRMLKLSQTRWLSRGKVIARILEQWDALLLFFQGEMKTDDVKLDGAGEIYKVMVNRGTKHMLLFLNYVLGKVDRMNLEFQSEQYRLATLHASIAGEYRSILGMFVKEDVLFTEKLSNINPQDTTLYQSLEKLNLGGRCSALLIKEPIHDSDAGKRFLIDCRNFLVELCLQMKKRFPFEEDSVIALMKNIDPKVAVSPHRSTYITSLAVHFPMVVKEEELDTLEDEWQNLIYSKETVQNLTQTPTSFWSELQKVKDGNNKMKFGVLARLMCGLLALPHSSACVERVFSQVNIIKTKQSNRLLATTISNRLLAKQAIARQSVKCFDWEPSARLIGDVKSGACHQRYVERCNKREVATIHPASDSDSDDPLPVHLH